MFLFGSDWDGLTKTAVFWQKKDQRYEVLLDETDSCDIPWEAQAQEGFMFVGAIGRNDNKVLASKILVVPVNEGTAAGSAEHNATQSIYDQLIANCGAYAAEAKDYASQAQESAEKASLSAVNTPYIGADGFWVVWDHETQSYISSGVSALSPEGGDMYKSTYDADGDGVIDNASKLGGISAASYATKSYVESFVASYVSEQVSAALEGEY